MSTKISIVIPAYNIEKELGPCLDSILVQTHRNFEIIIVNDGSKDNTAAVIEKYAALDPRIKPIHKENGGVTSARLRGIRESTGDWIGFVDGDDFVEPQMYARLLENAEKHNADISHCGYQMVFPSRVDYYYNTGLIVEQDHEAGLKDLICANFIEPALVNKLYKRSLFKKLLEEQLMDSSIRNFEDLLMNFYLFQAAEKSVFEDICPYHYILRPGSAATGKLNEHKLLDPLRVLWKIYQALPTDSEAKSHAKVRILRQLVNLSTIPLNSNRALIVPHRKAAQKELRRLLPEMRSCPVCSKKLYLMAWWAAHSPLTYQWVHSLHGFITGNSKKYEVK